MFHHDRGLNPIYPYMLIPASTRICHASPREFYNNIQNFFLRIFFHPILVTLLLSST